MPKFDYSKPKRSKAPWFQAQKKKPAGAKSVRIAKVSVKRTEQLKEYYRLLRKWKRGKWCQCCGETPIDCHHKRGKIHRLLCMVEFWIPLCRKCHDAVKSNPVWARAMGLLCAKGEWNKVP